MGKIEHNKEISKRSFILRIIIFIVLSSFVNVTVVFLGVVRYGWSSNLQEIWVATAMTTQSHKWLAESFLSDDTINKIMERAKVDDSGYSTDNSLINMTDYNNTYLELIDTKKAREGSSERIFKRKLKSREEIINKYESQGYSLLTNKGVDVKTADDFNNLDTDIFYKEVSGSTWKGYITLIPDASKVELTQTSEQFKCGETVKNMVESSDAVLGVNGGGFNDGPNYDSNGGTPAGILIVDGKVVNSYGADYKHNLIGFDKDNKLILSKMTTDEAIEKGIRDAVEFKPYLIVNGETIIKSGTGGWGIAPRTAIGQTKDGAVLFLCVDGRQVHSIGVDIKVLQDTLYAEGCLNAAMMDGGSSTVMYSSELDYINKPSLGHERSINNAWIVK